MVIWMLQYATTSLKLFEGTSEYNCPRILQSGLAYLITNQWRHAGRHEPVVSVFLLYNHKRLRMRQHLLLRENQGRMYLYQQPHTTYLIDHSANIWFSLWCSKKCLIPINRARLGRILLIASRLCKNRTLVSCWRTYYFPPQETLGSLLSKSD